MTTHREMMYDPDTSTRAFKRFCQTYGGTQGRNRSHYLEVAYTNGQFAALDSRRRRRNPYPPGKRHDEWCRGFNSYANEPKRR